ncbi:MAG: tetratricopeptide repeat protein [Thermodesulfobacteriota bacterium]|nr:tetratricopeptide repeat protein [Thermodesulfobacteriota bacterium]
MKHPHLFLITGLIPILGFVFILSSCAPAPSIAPSGALREQLHEIKQQQSEQANQLQQLQQQLVELQQQLTAENTISSQIQSHLETSDNREPPPTRDEGLPKTLNPFTLNQDIANVAASASAYLAAFSNLAAGNLSEAEIGFQGFLLDFPDHQYSPNARYWLANAQSSQGKTRLAIANLQQIVADPNGETKAPAALMQLAQLYQQEELSIQADAVLEQLHNRYPESPEAQQLYRSDEPTN